MRIARATVNNDYVQPLKLGISERLVVAMNVNYNSIILRNTHRPSQKSDIKAMSWMKFDTENFDGVQLLSYLSKDSQNPISSGACTYSIYSISRTDSWAPTLQTSGNATALGDGSFFVAIPASSFSIDLDGDISLYADISMTRLGKTYKSRNYNNHLGSYDSIVRLRNKIKFLEITKKDFGV